MVKVLGILCSKDHCIEAGLATGMAALELSIAEEEANSVVAEAARASTEALISTSRWGRRRLGGGAVEVRSELWKMRSVEPSSTTPAGRGMQTMVWRQKLRQRAAAANGGEVAGRRRGGNRCWQQQWPSPLSSNTHLDSTESIDAQHPPSSAIVASTRDPIPPTIHSRLVVQAEEAVNEEHSQDGHEHSGI